MKKFFLFTLAAVSCVTTALAECPAGSVDTIPAQRCISDFEFDESTRTLSFVDNYRTDVAFDRAYYVSVYERVQADLKYGCKFRTVIGVKGNLTYIYAGGDDVFLRELGGVFNSHGGKWTMDERDVRDIIEGAYSKGWSDIIFIVDPYRSIEDEITGTKSLNSYYSGVYDHGMEVWNLSYINYFTYKLPPIGQNSISVPNEVLYGEDIVVEGKIISQGKTRYKIQESKDEVSWNTIKTGTISAEDARGGATVQYKKVFAENGYEAERYYRIIAKHLPTGESDTSEVKTIKYLYARTLVGAGDVVTYGAPGEEFDLNNFMPLAYCEDYRVTSDLPVAQRKEGEGWFRKVYFTMPACNITIQIVPRLFTVKFLNADYTVLDVQQVECGSAAVAPTNPTFGELKFIGWSKEFNEVIKDMSVIARYELTGDYSLGIEQTGHTNSVHLAPGFAGNAQHAMTGDSLTFEASLLTPAASTLYFETAYFRNGAWDWTHPTNNVVGSFSDADATAGQAKTFSWTVPVAYTSNYYESSFEDRFAFRFYAICAANKIYSEPMEYDIYYPMNINSLIEVADLQGGLKQYEGLTYVNNDGDYGFSHLNGGLIPARHNDTIRIYRDGGQGACLKYSESITHGEDEEGTAYIIAPGQTLSLDVTVSKVAVVFDGAYPTQSFDFTSEGLGKFNNAYYAEVVNCGGSVQNIPADPEDEGYIFLGWKSWDISEYPDDAYLHVPAVGNVIGFSPEWEEIPAVDTFDVKFFEKDGITQIGETQRVAEGENAVPPVAPEVDGFHFTGWDKPYTTITENTNITAVYGEDIKSWTVTFLDWDGTTLNTQQVVDGQAALEPLALREGYKFLYWMDEQTQQEQDMSHIWSDMTVKAVYEKAQGIEEVIIKNTGERAQKVLFNGQVLIIMPDGSAYNAQGIRVK